MNGAAHRRRAGLTAFRAAVNSNVWRRRLLTSWCAGWQGNRWLIGLVEQVSRDSREKPVLRPRSLARLLHWFIANSL